MVAVCRKYIALYFCEEVTVRYARIFFLLFCSSVRDSFLKQSGCAVEWREEAGSMLAVFS